MEVDFIRDKIVERVTALDSSIMTDHRSVGMVGRDEGSHSLRRHTTTDKGGGVFLPFVKIKN